MSDTSNPIQQGAESPANLNSSLPTGNLAQLFPQEIMEGIINLSNGSRQRQSWDRELEVYRNVATLHSQPQFALPLLLFRRYAEVANDIKDQRHNDEHLHGEAKSGLLDDLHQIANYSYESEVTDLSGWNAMKTYTFWFRFFTALFAFLAVVIMSSVPYIGMSDFAPSRAFTKSCNYIIKNNFRGTFDMRPYQLIISVGVITYIYSFLIMAYFLLPMDASRRRFIPGKIVALFVLVLC